MSGLLADRFPGKRLIVASVGVGPYKNRGNVLIERSSLRVLGLPRDTPRFSVFEPITDDLLSFIHEHDYLVVTGCTTLQDDQGHQRCFDHQFARIQIPKICFAGTFFCETEDQPGLRIARMFSTPLGVRDPWAFNYLKSQGLDCEFIGCPTLLDVPQIDDWKHLSNGEVLVSSTPEVPRNNLSYGEHFRYLAHDIGDPGENILSDGVFDHASLVVTSRLHAALPAIARGTKVCFYSPRLSGNRDYGSNRYSLLEYLGVPLDGRETAVYPATQLAALRRNCTNWIDRLIAKT